MQRARRAAGDGVIWIAALVLAVLCRYDFASRSLSVRHLALVTGVAVVCQLSIGSALGLYVGRWMIGSFDELPALAFTVLAVTLVISLADLGISPRPIPLSSAMVAGFLAFVFMGAARWVWRDIADRRHRPGGDDRTRVLVFGAGDAGQQAVRALLRDPNSPYVPVAILDDDPQKLGLSIRGVRVFGDRTRLAAASERYNAATLLIAVPTADSATIRNLLTHAESVGLDVQILPSVNELLDGKVRVVDIREPTTVDLLGRELVESNSNAASRYLTDRIVAVSGAGGSIGSELCRQIWELGPSALIMIDRDESALHAVQLALEGRALLDSDDVVLLDIRDRDRVARLFEARSPDVVFHAAALKHLPLLQAHPVEALKTNVWGTRSVLDAAAAIGVERFVNISTDKAANPCSVLGYSKRICEGLTAHQAMVTGRPYVSVRFGNVLRSRGSVLTAFRAQVAAGGPITVTHPDVARFFMTIEEAVELVLQAGAIGRGGEALVLEMGEQVLIADVARRLANSSNPPIPIEFTGLRPGEKLREELFSDDEHGRESEHPLIRYIPVPPLDPDSVRDVDPSTDHAELVRILQARCDYMARRLGEPVPWSADGDQGFAAVS